MGRDRRRCSAHNTHLDPDGCHLVIDPLIGALIESSRGVELGPPKTAESARTITLPAVPGRPAARPPGPPRPSRSCSSPPPGEPHRRSNFGRRALRPAADGTLYRPAPPVRLEPVKPGLTFHGLRHGHKTWMIADGVPEVAQARRLGHILGRPDPARPTPTSPPKSRPACSTGCRTAGTKPSPTALTNPRGGNRDRATRSRPTTDAAWGYPRPPSAL